MKYFSSAKNNNSKCKRAGRITFYCEQCKCIHHDHKRIDTIWLNEDVMICRTSFDYLIKYNKDDID